MRLLDGFSRAGAVRFSGRRDALMRPTTKAHSNMRCVLGLVTVLLTLVVSGPSTALASGVWSAPTDIGDSSLFPNSVSCSSATFCAAVAGTFASFTGYGYALTYNGTSWTAPTNIGSSGGDLRSVSCPSATFCVAVGSGGAVGGAVTYNGTSWTASISLGDGAFFDSVSCASATFCAAVGSNGPSGYAMTYNGTSWVSPTNIGSGDLNLDSVSCPSATFCVALGNDGSHGGYAVTYNGTSWSAPTPSGPENNGNSRVSCASATFCAAAFYAFSGSYVQTYNGTSWATPTKVGAMEVLPLSSVSCPSATFCVVVGNNGSGGGYALTYDGTSWAGQTVDTGYTGEFRGLNSVSCPSTSFCEAVSSGTALTYTTATAGEASASVKIEKFKATTSSLMLTIKTSRAGTVTITGPGLKKTTKTVAAGTRVMTVALTKAGKAERAAREKIKLSVSLKTSIKTVSRSAEIKL
jgi:hypothetical protein